MTKLQAASEVRQEFGIDASKLPRELLDACEERTCSDNSAKTVDGGFFLEVDGKYHIPFFLILKHPFGGEGYSSIHTRILVFFSFLFLEQTNVCELPFCVL